MSMSKEEADAKSAEYLRLYSVANPELLFFSTIQKTSRERNKEWDPDSKLDAPFFALELAGEAGEVANKVKKLVRASLGLKGSTTTVEEVGKEIGDVILSACNLANALNIDLPYFTQRVFNDKSKELGFTTTL